MFKITSRLENQQFDLFKLEQKLKPIGYEIGGNWEYDHGYFDYKIDDQVGYQYLRVPFRAIDGQLDARNCTVALERPFLLSHKYQRGIDDHAEIGNLSASFNQFQEPVDKDASFPLKYIDTGKALVTELESILLGD
ncbi:MULTISPECIES: YugN-like family protein [unclassified Bacillus (in: firmicutes)]|uniref:YugN-like family protein n=1 Tax=unclassified Bacillus (in: firmicutes) TaxID=185979 RepID=UPI0008E81A02|nr:MULTISPECIES: YugN-like family protein [unclassified Bacillus (in: firmicutes)]SFB13186.1 YugN-like family protein [Bacillus sp. UNCCL13]SFQ90082.1 YugN-like family protein [Bacillus sp. cl95]